MSRKHLRRMTICGLMMALTCITTMFLQIPVVGTHGYVHLGDAFILLSGALFGPGPGLVVGAVGSAMADVLGGYVHWAPFTLVIKGVEGLLAGWLLKKAKGNAVRILVLCLGALWMAAGYLAVECVLYTPPVAIVSLPANLAQGAFSVIIACMLQKPLLKFLTREELI